MIINRLSRKAVDKVPSNVPSGILALEGPGQVNNIPVDDYSYLLPDRNDSIVVRTQQSGSEQDLGRVPVGQLPDATEASRILLLGKLVAQCEEAAKNWDEWSTLSPLVLDQNPDIVSLSEFDKEIIKYLWHLEYVNRLPKTWLTLETEKVSASRARRIPVKAYEYLANHTEDWEYRSISSVVPRRVLSLIGDDLVDYYENRLAARLIDELYRYLASKFKELRELNNDQEKQVFGTHLRKDRVFSLWGQAISPEQAAERLKPTLSTIADLHQRVRAMFDGNVYQAIPARSKHQVPDVVRHTNVLRHDRHYRFVNILWERALKEQGDKPVSNAAFHVEQQRVARAFDRYCMLLLVRSLFQLGFIPKDSSVPLRDERLFLNGRLGEIELVWHQDGTAALRYRNEEVLRIIPILSKLARPGLPEEVKARIAGIEALAQTLQAGDRPLILFPGSQTEIEQHPPDLQLRLNSNVTFGMQSLYPSLIPVSVYELGVVERLCRALRWTFWGDLYRSYPLRLKFPAKFWNDLSETMMGWARLDESTKQHIYIINQWSDKERQLRSKLQELKGVATRRGRTSRQDVQIVSDFEHRLEEEFIPWLEKLMLCPICKGMSRFIESRENACFECSCDSCGTTWGLQMCRVCGERFPYLYAPDSNSEPDSISGDWADRHYGMDILALPCPFGGYICPECGSCPDEDIQDPEICAACPSYLLA